MLLARQGDTVAARRARETLRLEQKLLDPAWGGAYQYSAGGNWDEPHFEKLIYIQSQVMQTYALAYAQWKDESYLKAAENIHRYVEAFLTSPDGAFYVSQDADVVEGEHAGDYFKLDDGGRRRVGVPRVDTHLYARENGWMIAALCQLYMVTHDSATLEQAVRAANWVIANRSLPDGGFRHDDVDAAGPYLGDTLAMGRAFLALYQATGNADWLTRARATLPFIAANFTVENGAGYLTSKAPAGAATQVRPERDENVAVARFSHALYRDTQDPLALKISQQAMRYLVTPQIAVRALSGGELLAISEVSMAALKTQRPAGY
jgi:hypothetical protein